MSVSATGATGSVFVSAKPARGLHPAAGAAAQQTAFVSARPSSSAGNAQKAQQVQQGQQAAQQAAAQVGRQLDVKL
jgi:hypothetical protein